MSDYRILITGSRDWTDRHAIGSALVGALIGASRREDVDRVVVVHGGARGADTLAGELAASWELAVEVHRADWQRHGKSAGHRRNAEMVAAGADVCLAFPLGESRGTRGCMAAAERAGIRVEAHEGTP